MLFTRSTFINTKQVIKAIVRKNRFEQSRLLLPFVAFKR